MERIFLYPYAGPGGRNYFKQIGTTQDVMLNDIKLEEGLRLSFIARMQTTQASRTGNSGPLAMRPTEPCSRAFSLTSQMPRASDKWLQNTEKNPQFIQLKHQLI